MPIIQIAAHTDHHFRGEVRLFAGSFELPSIKVVLNEADQPLSSEAPVHFNPLEACWYRLDWQRID